ncbi:MAG TPA: hypothetical protein VMU34_05075 [Mycobacterium sp.]|nr:hypothetical protein [Mycobacterium sp.]
MASGVAWWVVAQLVSQLSRAGRAVVHVDRSGRSTLLSVAASAEMGTGLIVVELPDHAASDERLAAACQLVSNVGTLAVVLPLGRGNDVAGGTVAVARAAGLVYLQHIVAVDVPVPGDAIDVPARTRPIEPAAHARVHRDVLIFTQPHAAEGRR